MRDGWNIVYKGANTGEVKSIKHDGEKYIGVCSKACSFYSGGGVLDYSGWTVGNLSSINGSPLNISIANNMFIAVGEGSNRGYDNNILYSPDGINGWKNTWDKLSAEGNNFKYAENINSISYVSNVGTFLGGNDGTIISLEDSGISTINVADAVKEMYEKLILQKQ